MMEQSRRRSLRMARRRRLLGMSPNTSAAGRRFQRGLARVGFHGVVVAVGLSVAAGVWSSPRATLSLRDSVVDVVDEVAEAIAEGLDDAQGAVGPLVASAPTPEPLKPLLRTVSEGDTIKAIAQEYSVSISTVLASNQLEDPDLITPGQELLIPPLEGLVAEVQPGETLAQLASRMGAEPIEIAQVNALPPDPEQAIPYERLIVPGLEPAERVAAPRRKHPVPVATTPRVRQESSETSGRRRSSTRSRRATRSPSCRCNSESTSGLS